MPKCQPPCPLAPYPRSAIPRRWCPDAQQPLLKLCLIPARVYLCRGCKGASYNVATLPGSCSAPHRSAALPRGTYTILPCARHPLSNFLIPPQIPVTSRASRRDWRRWRSCLIRCVPRPCLLFPASRPAKMVSSCLPNVRYRGNLHPIP